MEKPILLKTLNGESTSRPPFWFMRQAGRVLPSYLSLKEKYSFWQLMKNPELGAKVTLLPVNDLGVDAAILFSDILVIPYAMGMGLEFSDQGPIFETALAERDDPLNDLNPDPSKLNYIYDVIDNIITTKPKHIPLIGFCGGPLTVLIYMLEGLGKRTEFPEAIKFIYKYKSSALKLIDEITELSVEYVKGQIKHGIEVFQLFETHSGLIPNDLYLEMFLPSVKRICSVTKGLNIPNIFFPKGLGFGISKITPEVCDFLSIDWQIPIDVARKNVHPEIGLQGNLDPRILFADKTQIEKKLKTYLNFGKENQDWIFNLGHGFMPGIPYENAKFLADWLKQADWGR